MNRIEFGNAEMELRCAGTLYWPDAGMLVVSDLHLEKGSSFSLRGFFLPPHDTQDTLARLEREIYEKKPRLLVLLGDSFHDRDGYMRLNDADRTMLERLLRKQETFWVAGNHDDGFVPDGIASYEMFERDGIAFRHEASGADGCEISGHYHPSAAIRHKGFKIKGRCFAVNGRRLVMPSFGSYTGGLPVSDPAFRPVLGEDFNVYLCSEKRVFRFESALAE